MDKEQIDWDSTSLSVTTKWKRAWEDKVPSKAKNTLPANALCLWCCLGSAPQDRLALRHYFIWQVHFLWSVQGWLQNLLKFLLVPWSKNIFSSEKLWNYKIHLYWCIHHPLPFHFVPWKRIMKRVSHNYHNGWGSQEPLNIINVVG